MNGQVKPLQELCSLCIAQHRPYLLVQLLSFLPPHLHTLLIRSWKARMRGHHVVLVPRETSTISIETDDDVGRSDDGTPAKPKGVKSMTLSSTPARAKLCLGPSRSLTFDVHGVLGRRTDTFDAVAPAVVAAFLGFDAAVVLTGPAFSGKQHLLQYGLATPSSTEFAYPDGIYGAICSSLFDLASAAGNITVELSFMALRGSEALDLVEYKHHTTVGVDRKGRFTVQNERWEPVSDPSRAMRLIKEGTQRLHKEAWRYTATSSDFKCYSTCLRLRMTSARRAGILTVAKVGQSVGQHPRHSPTAIAAKMSRAAHRPLVTPASASSTEPRAAAAMLAPMFWGQQFAVILGCARGNAMHVKEDLAGMRQLQSFGRVQCHPTLNVV